MSARDDEKDRNGRFEKVRISKLFSIRSYVASWKNEFESFNIAESVSDNRLKRKERKNFDRFSFDIGAHVYIKGNTTGELITWVDFG